MPLTKYRLTPSLLLLAASSMGLAVTFDYNGQFDTFRQVTTDGNGNVYVVGNTFSSVNDILAVSCQPNGTLRWSQVQRPNAAGSTTLNCVVKGTSLYTFATTLGMSDVSVGLLRFGLANGGLLSSDMQYIGAGGATNTTISANGTAYISGFQTASGLGSGLLYKYASPGPGSINLITPPPNEDFIFYDVVALPGGIYVTGEHYVNGDFSAFVAKYNPSNLSLAWMTHLNDPSDYRLPIGIRVDSSGNLLVAGNMDTPFQGMGCFVTKLNTSGVILGEMLLGRPEVSDETAYVMQMVGDNVILGGESEGGYFVTGTSNDLTWNYYDYDPALGPVSAMTSDGTYAYIATTGSRRIRKTSYGGLAVYWNVDYPTYGNVAGLASHNGFIYAISNLSGDGKLAKINASTGALVW